MIKKILPTLALFLTVFLTAAPALHPVLADNTNVQITTESGATYLTTTTISTTSTQVSPLGTPVPAGTPIPVPPGTQPIYLPPGFFPSVNALTSRLTQIIMAVAVILVFAYLVMAGIQYITSGGEKGKTEAARNKIISAIVGLIIVASSYAILSIVLRFIGYSDFNGVLNFDPTPTVVVTPAPTPTPTPVPTPTPTSALQKLLQ